MAPPSDDDSRPSIISVPLAPNIILSTKSSLKKSATSSAWDAVFAAASKIEPVNCDDCLPEPSPSTEDPGIGKVSELAKSFLLQSEKDDVKNEESVQSEKDDMKNEEKKKKKKKKDKKKKKKSDSAESECVEEEEEEEVKKPEKKKKKKKRKAEELDLSVREQKKKSNKSDSAESEAALPSFPYPTLPDDHCESPLESYAHITPLLHQISHKILPKRTPPFFQIYDPYYCDGSVKSHLSSMGFPHVHNEKRDCYAVWKSDKEPDFDSLVTNPPYSADHIEHLLKYITSTKFGNKPWFLLLPQWVHKKNYFTKLLSSKKNGNVGIRPFYLVPKKRYVYIPPPKFRDKKKSATHKKSSPFVSMWYCWGGTEDFTSQLVDCFYKHDKGSCELARSKSALRDLRRKHN